MAVAVDTLSRTGSGEDKIISRKSLMVQPAMPRFIYPGDIFQIDAVVYNGSSAREVISIAESFEGVEILSGPKEKTASAASGETVIFKYKVQALPGTEARVRFSAAMGRHKDAVENPLKILMAPNKKKLITSTLLRDDKTLELNIPEERISGSGSLEMIFSFTALSELKGAVDYLMNYPHGCIEQTTSTAYPLVVLEDLLPDIGVEVNKEDLKKYSEAGIKRILSFMTNSGGLAFWPGDETPHPFGTAFGSTALIEAQNRGFQIPKETFEKLGAYMEKKLKQGRITKNSSSYGDLSADIRAFYVMTLGRLGRSQASYINTLWHSRDKLSVFGLSVLATAIREIGGNMPLLEEVLREIRNQSIENEEEAWFNERGNGGWSMGSGLRSHGAALSAFALSGVETEFTGKLLRGLLNRRKNGLWGSTQENVFGIMGIYDAMGHSATENENAELSVTLNNREFSFKKMEKLSSNIYRLILDESSLNLHPKTAAVLTCNIESPSSVYVTGRFSYDAPYIEKYMSAESKGINITRRFETVEGFPVDTKNIPLGSLVRVILNIKGSKRTYYNAFSDMLPAGLEPLNVNLAATETITLNRITPLQKNSLEDLSYSEVRDHMVGFYVDKMLRQEYEFSYIARAITPGTFLAPGGIAEAMYETDYYGKTSSNFMTISEKREKSISGK